MITGVESSGKVFQQVQRIDGAATAYDLLLQPSGGNVGIGTSTNFNSLNGRGNLVVGSGSGNEGITIYSGSGSQGGIIFADGTSGTAAYPGQIQYTHSDNSMRFYVTDGSEKMRISSDGKIGLGTTSPSTALDIAASTNSTNSAVYPVVTVQNTAANSDNSYAALNVKGGNGQVNGFILADGRSSANVFSIRTETATPIQFNTNGSERMRMLSGGGLTFNGDTATANALDDYEEGSWTPTASTSNGNGSFSVTVNYAKYIKVGGLVHASCYLSIVVSNVGSGAAIIGGLPFVNTSGQGYSIASVGHASAIEYHTNDGVAAYVTNGHNYIRHVNVTDTGNVGWSGTGTKYYMMSATYHSV